MDISGEFIWTIVMDIVTHMQGHKLEAHKA